MCLYVRELRLHEAQKIQRILRRSTNRVEVRRAQVLLPSEQGYKTPAIAELVHYCEHHVRAIIKEFDRRGLKALEPNLRSGRPAEFTEDDRALVAETAKCPPDLLACPFKRWSLEKLRQYLVAEKIVSSITIETLGTILHQRKVRLRRTKTWKECDLSASSRGSALAGILRCPSEEAGGLCSSSEKTPRGLGSVEALKEKVSERSTHSFDIGQFLASPQTEDSEVLPTEQYSRDLDADQCFMAQSYQMRVYSCEGIRNSWKQLSKS